MMPQAPMPGQPPADLPYGQEPAGDQKSMLVDAIRQVKSIAQELGLDFNALVSEAGGANGAGPALPPPPMPQSPDPTMGGPMPGGMMPGM